MAISATLGRPTLLNQLIFQRLIIFFPTLNFATQLFYPLLSLNQNVKDTDTNQDHKRTLQECKRHQHNTLDINIIIVYIQYVYVHLTRNSKLDQEHQQTQRDTIWFVVVVANAYVKPWTVVFVDESTTVTVDAVTRDFRQYGHHTLGANFSGFIQTLQVK